MSEPENQTAENLAEAASPYTQFDAVLAAARLAVKIVSGPVEISACNDFREAFVRAGDEFIAPPGWFLRVSEYDTDVDDSSVNLFTWQEAWTKPARPNAVQTVQTFRAQRLKIDGRTWRSWLVDANEELCTELSKTQLVRLEAEHPGNGTGDPELQLQIPNPTNGLGAAAEAA